MLEISWLEGILGVLLVASALGVLLTKQPVHACLFFLVTLLTLAVLYFKLSAQFIAVMQIIVYAGAILVLFMFVIVLFQDAHRQLELSQFINLPAEKKATALASYGTVESLGQALYIDFFFPFEAVILIFIIAVVGALYIAKKVG
jgi:NADH-quinone oxidoreductase subunit J